MNSGSFLRIWIGCVLGCLPILALLLVPQLMRSRAGDEQLLLIGTALLAVLLIGAFVCAPIMAAWFSPVRGGREPRAAWRCARGVWQQRRGGAMIALAAGATIYVAGQVIGYIVGALVPYVSDNPAHLTDQSQSPWIIHYPAYALQAGVLYVMTTLAVAVYSWRLRSLRLSSGVRQ
ncbi:hypothetical protein [Microbacterium murale]|uniref:F0F1-type ATP synthase membrane subunit c/vacuolar-type H+-ATPase subunit K n=1 Tax=Microbacterium murale TaxID=1081040 RepID=A0ABU0P4E1_9MICO|nr:hypothetical protein [Microbacterium murale]MDQ0642201.1 F0F1-type ATP synthase membrane subunit c/vacuolar-type H+-ATPase subunit K [Microbacterium murale]